MTSSSSTLTEPPSLVEEDASTIQTTTTTSTALKDVTSTMDDHRSPGASRMESNPFWPRGDYGAAPPYYSRHLRDERKLFVGGLPHNITNEQFRTFFEQFGTLLDSIVLMDKESQRPRGFGFVKFQHVQVARNLLAVSQTQEGGGLKMHGKTIDLKIAEPKEAVQPMHHHDQKSNSTPPPYNNMMATPPPELINEGPGAVPVPFTYAFPCVPPPTPYMPIVLSQCYDPVIMMMMDPLTGLYYSLVGPNNGWQSW